MNEHLVSSHITYAKVQIPYIFSRLSNELRTLQY